MILVFGGNGQLGRELTKLAASRRAPLVALGRAEADITDSAAVAAALSAHRPLLVVNAAAYTNVDRAESDTAAAAAANATGPAVIAAACARAAVPLVHVSTDYVFDGRKAAPYQESDPVAPLNVYGRTKAAGEAAVRAALPRHVILRTAWLYGAFGHNFLKTILRLARERDELRVVADQHGSPTSSRELAAAILHMAPRLAATGAGAGELWGTYHLTGAGATTWHGFAAVILAAQRPLTGRTPKLFAITTAEYPTPAVRPANATLDCRRFAQAFGWRARPWDEEATEITRVVVRAQQGAAANVA